MLLSVIDYIAIVIFSLLLGLIISSTIYDLYMERNLCRPLFNKSWYNSTITSNRFSDEPTTLYLAFSLHRNYSDLLKIEPPSSKTIECFYGLRALAVFWVVAGHRLWKHFSEEPLKYTGPFSEFVTKVVWNNKYAAEVFFLMAGILVTLSTLKALDEKRVNLLKMYIGRYGRYMPTLAAILLFIMSSFPALLVDGYLKKYFESRTEPCHKYWWSSLLLVQTYVNPTAVCIRPTWYLSADFHLFVLSPAFIFTVWKLKYKAFLLFATVILANQIGIFVASYYDTVPNDLIYYQTHFRIGQFLVGIALGYIMHERKGKHHMRKRTQCIGWIVTILVFVSIEVIHKLYQEQRFVKSLYSSVGRLAWTVLTSWAIFVCHHLKSGGVVNWCLSHPVWQPIAKMSMSIYLIHEVYQSLTVANMEAALSLNSAWMIHIIGGDIIASIVFGAVVYCVIEAPSIVILKCLLK
ncbi:O-acyltransferase like protein-like [Bradysia coprophila]|uniref:O-acyltransferase like protein-like n=1 Tax=Bradysia coprophila TaxID=38358 RepID=UPI00187D84BF|nr:O-acyltransferase like protein-like [Bradysia coprophila]